MVVSISKFLNTLIFTKSSIIHDYHAFYFKIQNKYQLVPVVKYIDILLKTINYKQRFFIKSNNDVSTFFRLPVVAFNTQFTYQVSVHADISNLKTAFVHIYNRIYLLYKAIKLILIHRSFYQIDFWIFQDFFAGTKMLWQIKDAHFTTIQATDSFIVIIIGVSFYAFNQYIIRCIS